MLNRRFWLPDSLGDVADRVRVSLFHLCRIFRSVTGSSIHQYRDQLRLRSALQAVIDTNDDLLSLGLRLGYSGHSHFTAAFHRRFSITPSELRRRRRTLAGVAGCSLFKRPGPAFLTSEHGGP